MLALCVLYIIQINYLKIYQLPIASKQGGKGGARVSCTYSITQEFGNRESKLKIQKSSFSGRLSSNITNLASDDPRVIESLRRRFLLKPSARQYNLLRKQFNDDINFDPSYGQTRVILEILKEKVWNLHTI